MEEHKVIIVVVILGITAIVMMGLVAKIALLETQVANAPRMHDNLRRQSVPKPKDNPPASNSRSGEARAASPGSSENGNPTNGAAQPSSPYGRKSPPQDAPQASSQPSSAPSAPPGRAAEEAFAEAENSIVRLTAVDHKEEKNGIAVAIREGGVLLSGAPLLSGAYEGWCMLPKSRQKTPPFNRCITYSPESYLALVRVDYKDEPLGPLPVASALPGKGDRVRA
jgi:hypothetical protein